MRPSAVRMGEMPGPLAYSPWWGTPIKKQKGIGAYTISPYQSKAAPNMIRTYIFNAYRRLSGEAFFFVIPFAIGYGTYAWAKKYDAWQNSKAGHIALGGSH
ncbi:cytochrome b-c1 complex subunit 8 [Schizophyllum commune]|nr:uncharacterized protein SCHCODRAFT_02628384 [Schizophyllum commune H4-8]KAI4527045.1 hypothetical protein K525DRAFT_257665 [Schizophyllum commune Loenen D]KAI5891199.1 hypothetical protein SCHCODRAFT_02628384 [Schizophyllum commune H4-8]